MARQATVIDVFLSSPSDLGDEREFVAEAAQEWNLLRSKATGCYINIITSDSIIAPALSDRPQSVINQQVGSDYDVYLGMMWSRLGSPTGQADSGTVEEFDRALDRYRGGEAVRLCMLFKTAPIPMAILQGEQFSKVEAFKRRFSSEGGLYREFEKEDELRGVLNRLFEQIAGESYEVTTLSEDDNTPLPAPQLIVDVAPDTLAANATTLEDLADIGLLDLNEQLTQVVTEQSEFLEGWTAALVSNSDVANAATAEMQELTRFGTADPSALKPIMSRVSASMNSLSQYVENNIDSFVEKNNQIIALSEAGLDLSTDFSASPDGQDMRSSIVELLAQLMENQSNLDELIGTTRGLPRMTTEFNRAKKRAISAQELMLDEISRLRHRLAASLERHESRTTL